MTGKQISILEVPVIVPQEEKLQEQNTGIEQVQEESRVSKKKKQKRRRITSYLSDISKQVGKNGNQINKINIMIQSLQMQRQAKLITRARGTGQSQFQSIKQIQSQLRQLQKQVVRIQNDIKRIKTAPVTKPKFRKLVKVRPIAKRHIT